MKTLKYLQGFLAGSWTLLMIIFGLLLGIVVDMSARPKLSASTNRISYTNYGRKYG